MSGGRSGVVPAEARRPALDDGARARLRRRLLPVVLGAEAVVAGAGLADVWQAASAGAAVSRPGVIAAVAGVVAFVATLAGAMVARRKERREAGRTP